jgi:hypothetical protein
MQIPDMHLLLLSSVEFPTQYHGPEVSTASCFGDPVPGQLFGLKYIVIFSRSSRQVPKEYLAQDSHFSHALSHIMTLKTTV